MDKDEIEAEDRTGRKIEKGQERMIGVWNIILKHEGI